MSVHKCLPDVEPFFVQDCPLCGQGNKMVLKGLYVHKAGIEKHPDLGYSFCTCKNLFYTRFENLNVIPEGFHQYEKPLSELKTNFESMASGENLNINMPDVFFCDWREPHSFLHWQPRRNHILWDMDTFCEEAKKIGFGVVSGERDLSVDSKTPKTMNIVLVKP